MLKIVTHPNEILRQKAKKIDLNEIKSKKMQDLIEQMAQTMLEKDGIGLAAPQIGKSIRIIIVNTKQGPLVMINPKITHSSWRKAIDEEGCLSVPNIYGDVKRPYSIKVKFFTDKAEPLKIKAKGLFARVIQHEIDHLNGVLFIDRTEKTRNLKEEVL